VSQVRLTIGCYFVGALAPPDGLDPADDFSGSFSLSADAPPDGVASLDSPAPLELPPLSGSSVASLPPDSFAGLSDFDVLDVDVDVDVEVVCAAAFSALVSFGGVISGVLLGTASEALAPPPHAPSETAPSSSATVSATALALTDPPCAIRAAPSACRTWGSR
jgi:hypothetical protein